MKIDDELLMAYVDGELGATERAAIEAALAQDADLRRRIESQKALRATLQGAFAPPDVDGARTRGAHCRGAWNPRRHRR